VSICILTNLLVGHFTLNKN